MSRSSELAFALLVTVDGELEIELGPKFGDADLPDLVASANAVARAIKRDG